MPELVSELTLLQHIKGGWRLYVTLTDETLGEGSGQPDPEFIRNACESYYRRGQISPMNDSTAGT